MVLWLTGLSGSGKSTLGEAVARELRAHGRKVEVLDGDAVRAQLSQDLTFSREDRDAQVARLAFIARLLARNGIDVVVAAISPYRAARVAARAAIDGFVEVHVSTPLAECIRRDPKGLYAKALAGLIPGFTGINDPYEEPPAAELTLDTSVVSVEESVGLILACLRRLAHLD